jgi:hypothetical protein
MQWFKGTQKIKEGTKFVVKYIEAGNNEYDIMLEIAVSRNDDIFPPPACLSFVLKCISFF